MSAESTSRAPFFLDTNVLVYSFDSRDRSKQKRANELIDTALHSGSGFISTQVVQEFLNVALRKFDPPMSHSEAEEYLDVVLSRLCTVHPSMALYQSALQISRRWHYSLYDSLIIAAALEARCTVLWTEDLAHGQQIGTLEIRNPFC